MISVAPEHLAIVREILHRHVPGREARVFGSRITGTFKPYSDLDIALVGPEPVAPAVMDRLREDFQQSDLPFRVDLIDWQTITPEFRAVIEKHYETL